MWKRGEPEPWISPQTSLWSCFHNSLVWDVRSFPYSAMMGTKRHLQVWSWKCVLLLLQHFDHRRAIHPQHFRFSNAGTLAMAMLCDVKVASVPAASLGAVQDMEHTREFVANELWSDERAGFAALHVLLPPQWFAKPSESAQPFLRRRRAHGDVDRGFPVFCLHV